MRKGEEETEYGQRQSPAQRTNAKETELEEDENW
jgi:hypothetical protein